MGTSEWLRVFLYCQVALLGLVSISYESADQEYGSIAFFILQCQWKPSELQSPKFKMQDWVLLQVPNQDGKWIIEELSYYKESMERVYICTAFPTSTSFIREFKDIHFLLGNKFTFSNSGTC